MLFNNSLQTFDKEENRYLFEIQFNTVALFLDFQWVLEYINTIFENEFWNTVLYAIFKFNFKEFLTGFTALQKRRNSVDYRLILEKLFLQI